MMAKLTRVAFCLLLAGLTTPSAAATFTEREFLSVLNDEHPVVQALGGRIAAAQQRSQSNYINNPGFDFFLESPKGAPDQVTLALTWKPPLDGRRGLSRRAGAAELAAAESALLYSKLQLRTTMRALYADWWRLTEFELLLAAHAESVERLAERTRRRVERGEESGLDAGRLRFAASEMRAAVASLRAELSRITAQLRVITPDLPDTATPERPLLPEAPAAADIEGHPAIATRRHEFETAQLETRLSGRVLEFPELLAGWTRLSGEKEKADGPVFGLQWNLPLFDRNQGDRARAKSAQTVAEAQLSQAIAETEARLASSRDAYRDLQRAAFDLEETTADATLLINAATSAFDGNETTVTDLLEALRSILSGRQAAIDLYHEALAAHRELELNVGRPLTTGGEE